MVGIPTLEKIKFYNLTTTSSKEKIYIQNKTKDSFDCDFSLYSQLSTILIDIPTNDNISLNLDKLEQLMVGK